MFENEDDLELLEDFIVESSEHLADIETEILAIEEAGENIDLDLVNKVFRGVHSIKGAAGFLGLEVVKELAHSLENVLNKIRSEEMVPSSENTDAMLRAGDTLRNLINDAQNSNSFDVTDQVDALEKLLEACEEASDNAPAIDARDDLVDELQQEVDAPEAASTDTAVIQEAVNPSKDSQESVRQPEVKKDLAPAPTEETPKNSGKTASAESSIRVPVGVLDQLMNLAGELVLNRNHLLQALASQERQSLEAVATELDQVTSKLQESIMQTRMQPIGNVFGKFPRIVRDLSSKLGKECKLEIEGRDVEVDKTIVEAIGDPLTHLIRNSVDHGIELPSIRKENDKDPVGSVWLRAFHKAGKVCIEIQDNGAGIDPDKLKAKAVEKGVISSERAEQMNDREAVRLIFHPGFSTAEKLSDVSGRGVGMDVVRTNIERLGGNVDVESVIGAGTKICVTLPLTLAIIPSMILKCGEERFAIPQANVAELVRLRPDEISKRIGKVQSAEVLRLRGNLLPLLNLQDSLDIADEAERKQGPISIVVVETGQLRYGLVVDGIHDSEEIVVKPLGRHLNSCSYFAGATILGDGRIALILDPAGIATEAGIKVIHESEDQDENSDKDEGAGSEGHTLLLFSSSTSDRFAVPMEVVARIERVLADQIDSVGGQQLLQYRGTSLPLISVSDHLTVSPIFENKRVYVIVFTIGEREVGLVAPQLDDIKTVSSAVDTETFRAPGVAGSLVIEDQTTRLLDLFELARASQPQWFERSSDLSKDGEDPTQIMLVEDSTFFRKQVAGFLSSEGYEVTEFEDGQEAWQALKSGSFDFDLIVSDIEMPKMNGFELCRNVKADNDLKHLPLIALTSLSSQDDLNRGKDAGFSDYQVKMHRENLVRAVEKFTTN